MARPKFTDDMIADRVEEILIAAMDVLVAEGGVDGVSLRKTAKVMNCSYSAIYRYFENKRDLLVALKARAFRRFELKLKDAVSGESTALHDLRLVSRAYIDAGLSRPDLYRLMFLEVKGEGLSQYFKDLVDAKRNALGVCTKLLSNAQENGELPKNIDPLTAAHVHWTSSHGLVSLEISNQFVMGRKVSVLGDIVMDAFVVGLRHLEIAKV